MSGGQRSRLRSQFEAVQSALSAAEESNRTQGDIYWKCAADLVEKLPGRWNGQAPE